MNVVEVSEEMLVLSEIHGGQRTPLLGVSELVLSSKPVGGRPLEILTKAMVWCLIFQVEGLSNMAFLGTRSKRSAPSTVTVVATIVPNPSTHEESEGPLYASLR